jgi:outer membrane protein, multidrug efflux system
MRLILAAAVSLALCGCTVGPRYQRPTAAVPTAWKEQAPTPFRPAQPRDGLQKGAWWTLFGDAELTALEQQALTANQSLEAARQQLNQARALACIQTAGYFPQANVRAIAERARLSGSRPTNGALVALRPLRPLTQNSFQIPFTINYEVDIFGRVRRSIEAANEQLQSQAAALQNAQLIITFELAADFFQVRELDAEIRVVNEGLRFEQEGLSLVERRYQGGIASGLEVAQQKAVLEATATQANLLVQQRKQFEHAIAALVGTPAANFLLAERPLTMLPPDIPAGVPSDVLERRPDIAQAEREVAAQNALIGVAESALYPSVNLFGQGGLLSSDITKLFSGPSLLWGLGPLRHSRS